MVFNKSGRQLKASHLFTFMGTHVPSAREYTYLGITFTLSGSFVVTQKNLKQKALRAYFSLKRLIDLTSISTKAIFKLFDSLILPIVSYGMEVWLPTTNLIKQFMSSTDYTNSTPVKMLTLTKDPIEALHVLLLKWTLGVPKRTSVMAVLGDCGREPLLIRLSKQFMDFHNNLYVKLDKGHESLATCALHEQKLLNLSWNQAVSAISSTDERSVLRNTPPNSKLCRLHMLAWFNKQWNYNRVNNKKLTFYNSIKNSYSEEPYLSLTNFEDRKHLARLRTSSHTLRVELGRYSSQKRPTTLVDKCCRFCCDTGVLELLFELPCVPELIIEDETHFLIDCPTMNSVRQRFKDVSKSRECIIRVLSSDDPNTVRRAAHFCTAMFKARKTISALKDS